MVLYCDSENVKEFFEMVLCILTASCEMSLFAAEVMNASNADYWITFSQFHLGVCLNCGPIALNNKAH